MEPSKWVRMMIKRFGKYVGFLISSSENLCISFFQKLERTWEEQVHAANTHQVGNSSQKGMRELRYLISTINYDGQLRRNTRGSLKSIGTDHCL